MPNPVFTVPTVDCPDGWQLWSGSCYLYLTQNASWSNALTACGQSGRFVLFSVVERRRLYFNIWSCPFQFCFLWPYLPKTFQSSFYLAFLHTVSTIFVRYTVVENSNYFYSSDRIKMIRYTQVLYSFSYQIFLLRYFHLNIPDIYIFRSSGHLSVQNNIRDTFIFIY